MFYLIGQDENNGLSLMRYKTKDESEAHFLADEDYQANDFRDAVLLSDKDLKWLVKELKNK